MKMLFLSTSFVSSFSSDFLLWFLLCQVLIPILTVMSQSNSWDSNCPCTCDYEGLRRRVSCTNPSLTLIPTEAMDSDRVEVLVVSGTESAPFQLTLGRIFQKFHNLKEVRITHSSIPAIGHSSFFPGKSLTKLDLSFNKISALREVDFNGLKALKELNLNDNLIAGIPSAAFSKLDQLSHLSIGRNKITHIVPRMFYQLERLEVLDLSGNPLNRLESDDLKDIKSLRSLKLSDCSLTFIHSLVYQTLPELEELDLRNNQLNKLVADEFKFLRKLKVLYLDGNQLVTIRDNTFYGHQLEGLGLSRNQITTFETCAFCNTSIKRLDMSHNQIKSIEEESFKPLHNSLIMLNAEHNTMLTSPSRSIYHLIRPLGRLKILSLSHTKLDDSLPEGMFFSQRKSLQSLDLSHNVIANVSAKWFESLETLEKIDLSKNRIERLTEPFLTKMDKMTTLKEIYLHENPWSCYRCHVLPLLDWLVNKPASYFSVCGKSDKFCAICTIPSELYGQGLHQINEVQLEWCTDPTIQLRIATSEPKMGTFLGLLIIISILAIIVTIIIMYRRKHGAAYYTHEEEKLEKSIFTIERNSRIRKSMVNSLSPSSPPMSPHGNSTPLTMSPPMSPCSPLRSHRSCSVSSIPPPPPLPPPEIPYHTRDRRLSSRAGPLHHKRRI